MPRLCSSDWTLCLTRPLSEPVRASSEETADNSCGSTSSSSFSSSTTSKLGRLLAGRKLLYCSEKELKGGKVNGFQDLESPSLFSASLSLCNCDSVGCLKIPSNLEGEKRSKPSLATSSPLASLLFHSGVSACVGFSCIVWCCTEFADSENTLEARRGRLVYFWDPDAAGTLRLEAERSRRTGSPFARACPRVDLCLRKLPLKDSLCMFLARCGMRLWERLRATLPFCRRLEREGAGEEDLCSDFQSSERESSHGSMFWCLQYSGC